MSFLSRLTVSRRLVALVALALLSMLALLAAVMTTELSLLQRERAQNVRQVVSGAHGIIAYYHLLASRGDLPEEVAKIRSLEAVRSLRYGDDHEYFWVNDMQARMVMHPIRPELDGKDMGTSKDPNGKALFAEFVHTVKSKGEGYVDYLWPKPGSDQPVAKISYVKGFAPWGWVIGSGVYVDNVRAVFMTRLLQAAGFAAALALLLLAVGWAVGRSILRQLGAEPAQLNAITHQIASGDLTAQIPASADAHSVLLGIRSMRDSVTLSVLDVRRGAEGVATASAEIAQGNDDLSARTEAQASALEQTAASMEQLSATVRQNADNAAQANQLAMNASTVAVQGGAVVAEVVDTMRGINDASRRIADIIGVIDGIAFQTNILALNAAVEAARAGEQGRGFAVVAGEVRSLAGRSAEAAKEIKQLITDSVGRVEQGTQLVDKAGATMTEVVNSIRRVTDIMGEISAASREQSAGVAQVGEAVTQMDQATQQNAALVEQSSAAAAGLKAQAEQLVKAVAVFKLAGHAGAATPAAAKVPPAAATPPPGRRIAPPAAAPVRAKARPAPPAPAALSAPPKAPTAAATTAQATHGREDDWESF
ncbi:methyl-accepting chemotaxis protein [Alicycliphilus denitrificans]|uniref:methyl-accepting chemotaxis protein n=1 Tax=Alicycliphilus denitrificans TaxID=179636 RepID=UPI00384CCA2C